jgi:magnesium transporter
VEDLLTTVNLNDPVTEHLHRDFTSLQLGMTVGAALEWLRAHPPAGRVLYLYVVDGDDTLCGVVPTRRLLLAAPRTPLADIMVRQVVTLPADATVLDACEFFIQHRLLAFPVVDQGRHVLGVVDVDLYTQELQDLGDAAERNHLFQLLGVHVARGMQASPLAAFRHRFPWLGCNLVAGVLAAFLSGVYKGVLEQVVALAFFIPVVLNLAESVSSQSVSLALQSLHERQPSWRWLLKQMGRELLSGALLGLGAGAIIALTALIWLGQGRVAVCLLGGITGGVAAAAALGLALPQLLRMLRLEPRVAAGPIALAAADVITILLYFNLARALLG